MWSTFMQKTIIKPTFWGYELNTATESSAFPIWLTKSPHWYLTANPHGHGQFPVHLHNHCEASQLSPAAVAEALPFRNLKQWTECRITIVHQTSHREWETQINSLFCEGREAEGGPSNSSAEVSFLKRILKGGTPYRGNGCIWIQEMKFHMNFSFRQRKGAKNHRDDGKTGDGTPKYIEEERRKWLWQNTMLRGIITDCCLLSEFI